MANNSVYEIVTKQIVQKLEQGTAPWNKPWSSVAPSNAISKKAYRGINTWLLNHGGYESPYWVSYKQAQELGGQVRKGERSMIAVFWKRTEREDPDTHKKEPSFVLRYYPVFNLDQCELPDEARAKYAVAPRSNVFDPIATCEQVVAGYRDAPTINHGGAAAYYRPTTDAIQMPSKETFNGAQEYYSTLFHEMGHSTGHSKRLDRKTLSDMCRFGDTNYSKEELVAEMTAAYLCGVAGIENLTIDNNAAYLASWIRALRGDAKLVVQAAANAQRAADHILDMKHMES
jgi:antirestriction protein ArdC